MDLLIAYCSGLENAVLRLADEVDSLQPGDGEAES